MNKMETRNATILVGLLLFLIYNLNNPWFFNKTANTRCGRLIIVAFILFATKYNIYLGFLSILAIIGLLQNLEEYGIVNIKKTTNFDTVKPSGFYTFFPFKKIYENFQNPTRNPVITKRVINKSNQMYTPDQSTDYQNTYKTYSTYITDEELINENKQNSIPDISVSENGSKFTINELLHLQNTITPKDSNSMMGTPLYFTPFKPDE